MRSGGAGGRNPSPSPSCPPFFTSWSSVFGNACAPLSGLVFGVAAGVGRPVTVTNGVEFTVTHKLGMGATGCVVRAVRGGSAYALKVVHKAAAARMNFRRANFARERESMVAVHERQREGREEGARYLMPLLMAWEEAERVFFVMVSRRRGRCSWE